jgi:LCP family protein required for cell wall assembly
VVAARALCALFSVVLLGVSGWGWYLGRVAQAAVNRTDAIPGGGGKPGGPMNLLLVGSDSRAQLTAEQRALLHTGGSSGMNTDTMILVHIPADGSRASFVSFPRDSWVEIPGHGWNKLNAAYAYGYISAPAGAAPAEKQAAGAQSLVKTLDLLTGLRIDHYAQVDLLGFYNLSTVVGGVQVNLCAPVDDHYSGARFPAGVQTISGVDALKFVRQRHGLPRGDFDRIVRQQTFIGGVLRKMLAQNTLLDLGKQRRLVQAAATSLTVDKSLDMLSLAKQMQQVTAGNIKFQTVPNLGTGRSPDGRLSIVQLADAGTVHDFFAHLSADPKPTTSSAGKGQAGAGAPAAPRTVAPSAVHVAVLNGSGVAGLAGTTQASLESAGYQVDSVGNADASDYAQTEIRYAPGDEAQAATLAGAIPGATKKESAGGTAGVVQLILGKDFNGVGKPLTAPGLGVSGFRGLTAGGVVAEASSGQASREGQGARSAADTSCIN